MQQQAQLQQRLAQAPAGPEAVDWNLGQGGQQRAAEGEPTTAAAAAQTATGEEAAGELYQWLQTRLP